MKKIVAVMFALCCGLCVAQAQRSLINGALNAASKGVSNAVAKKVESIAEKQMEVYLTKKLSAYEQHLAEESKKYQEAMGAWQDSLIAMTNVPFEDEYQFNTVVNTEVVMTNEQGEKETLPCSYYMNAGAEYFGYGVETMITVIDYKNNVMVCFSSSDTSNVYFAYKYTPTSTTVEDESLQKLSGTKTVCGYSCSGYKIIGPMYTGDCWASSSSDFAGNYTNMYVPKSSYGFPLYMEGVIVGTNGEKVNYVSTAKKVQKNASVKLRKADYKNMFE
ncbi:MAG: hypothetical protein II663_00705 [Bacteroidales bacterium]|nr:hypothetical protein [Bacteroidales bacterium]